MNKIFVLLVFVFTACLTKGAFANSFDEFKVLQEQDKKISSAIQNLDTDSDDELKNLIKITTEEWLQASPSFFEREKIEEIADELDFNVSKITLFVPKNLTDKATKKLLNKRNGFLVPFVVKYENDGYVAGAQILGAEMPISFKKEEDIDENNVKLMLSGIAKKYHCQKVIIRYVNFYAENYGIVSKVFDAYFFYKK